MTSALEAEGTFIEGAFRSILTIMNNSDNSYQLSLLVTERCNLYCSYCYCDKQRTASMTLETAQKAIDEVLTTYTDRPLRLLLMGGEPFIEFGLLKGIVEYIRQRYHGRDVFVKTVTNGTLVHGEVQQWLMEKMVACPDNMDHLADDVITLQEQGFRVKCVLADDCHWDPRHDPERWVSQLSLLVDYYLANPEQMPFNQLLESLNIIGSGAVAEKCRPGCNTHCVGVDGRHYGCHRCTPYYNNGIWRLDDDSIVDSGMLHNGCAQCPAQPVCCSCPALVASVQGNIELREAICALFKVTHLANAVLLARMFTECPNHIRLRNLDDNTKHSLIAGAQCIIQNLQL